MSFFYTTHCIYSLLNKCDEKTETSLRILYTLAQDNPLKTKHFLYHDLAQMDTPHEYGALGHLLKIIYWKNLGNYTISFENKEYTTENIYDKIYIHENVSR
jgi:hypothetical protein